jgi:hypothetical protein
MDLLEKFAPKKKKTPGINQCGEKGGGGGGGIKYPPDIWIFAIQNQKIKN